MAELPWQYRKPLLLPRPSTSAPVMGHGSFYSSSSLVIGRNAALRIHSQAEKRRRERINSHLSTLRRMIPGAHKMDKASLLARVVDQVKSLKRKAIDVTKGFAIPTEVDEVTVMECHGVDDVSSSTNKILYKVSICCEDRPDLFADLTQAFNRLRLKTIRADLTSLGGRVQNAFILCYKDDNASVCLSALKESLKEALGMVVSTDVASQDDFSGPEPDGATSTRQIFPPKNKRESKDGNAPGGEA